MAHCTDVKTKVQGVTPEVCLVLVLKQNQYGKNIPLLPWGLSSYKANKGREKDFKVYLVRADKQYSLALVNLYQETGQVGIQKEETCCFSYNKMHWTN